MWVLVAEHRISGVGRTVKAIEWTVNTSLFSDLEWVAAYFCKAQFYVLPLDPFASIAFRTWFCFLRKCTSEVRELCCSEPWIKLFAEPINMYIKDDLWVISRSLKIKLSRQEQFLKLQKNMLWKVFIPYVFWRLSLQTERQFRLMPRNLKLCITSTSRRWAAITQIAKLSLLVFNYQPRTHQDKKQQYFVTLLF